MKDEDLSAVPAQAGKTKEQLINELEEMRQRITELEASENERKQAEETLRKSEEKYRTFVDNIQDGAFIIQGGKMEFVNKAFARMAGYTVKEVIGMDFRQLIAPEGLEIVADRYRRRQAGEDVPREYEFRMLRKDGKTRVIVNMNVGLVDYRGRVASMGTVKDITESKRAEEELRESEERYRTVFENTGTATVIIEEDMTISMTNTEYEKLTGYTKQEVEGKMKWAEIAVEEDRERMKEYHVKRRGKEEAPTEYEFCLVDKHGNIKDIFVMGGMIPGTKRSMASLMDITPRKQAEDALRASEERFRTLAEDSPFGLSIMKPDTTFEYFNPKFTEIFGYTVQDLPNKEAWFEKAYPDKKYRREVISIWEKDTVESIKDREIKPRVFTVRCKDAQDKIIHFRAVVLKDGKQFLTYENITAQANAEEALQQSEEKYRGLVENSFDGIFVQKGSKIIFTNQRLNEMLGYDEGELLGLDHWLVYHPDYQEITRKRAQARMRGEKTTHQYEVKLQRKDGSWFYGEINARAISLEEEHGIQVWVRDITDRKKAEEELKTRQTYLESVLYSAPDAIVTLDASHHVLEWNIGAERIFGYTRHEVVGKNIDDLVTGPDVINESKELTTQVLSGGNVLPRETVRYRKDGTPVNVIVAGSPIIIRDELQGVVAVYTDMTERKKAEKEKKNLEAQLLQAHKMEAIGTLAGGIAHNFNNLLMSIQGNTSLMLLDTTPEHPHYERLTNIEKSVQSGSKLTSQLLGYARGGRYEVKPISINRIITDTCSTFSMTRKDIALHHDLANNLSGVKADHGQIEQVLLNICVNAAEAMVRGGELFITTRNITHKEIEKKPYTIKPGNYILLTIRDTGTGMDKATQSKIFDPFFTTKGLAKGTGLGLASVYGIMKAHGGYIDVESQKGKGTTFFLYLPASKETIGEEVQQTGTIIKGKETILLVDDEEIILDVGQELLKALGYKVLIAGSGKEAIETLRTTLPSSFPDMVILDMIMPVIGGGETYDKLKEINPDIKVLLSSGYSIDGQATEILKRGCDGFIQKPFTMKDLSRSIREILEK